MTDIVEQLHDTDDLDRSDDLAPLCHKAADEIERLRAVIVRAKDALLDGQSTQWVHDLLVAELARRAQEPKP